eukprot:GHVN01072046.1.p1 GENE.GHVN01072046.1~~GHVN01072046.1.p1  ORF type:complete len:130 (+),score=8.88 GHVN01072046.1:553-942(+)
MAHINWLRHMYVVHDHVWALNHDVYRYPFASLNMHGGDLLGNWYRYGDVAVSPYVNRNIMKHIPVDLIGGVNIDHLRDWIDVLDRLYPRHLSRLNDWLVNILYIFNGRRCFCSRHVVYRNLSLSCLMNL